MSSNKLFVQNFRTNDLKDHSGSQIEFGKAWLDFLEIEDTQSNVSINLLFKSLNKTHENLNNKEIELKLAEVTARGDRKTYANDSKSGHSALKEFFLYDLHLTPKDNAGDYFAFYKVSELNYFLYYIPRLLYVNFIKFFETITPKITISRSNEIKSDKTESFQQIFYGAPGTGKSHKVKGDEKVKIADEKNLVFRTTFHPDSDYSTFVGAYKPTMKSVPNQYKAVVGKDEEITYEFIPQAFMQAYTAAWNNQEENVFLIIEEINRGNCAQIFGDLFQLLDRDEKGESEYPIKADRDLAKFLNGKDDQGIEVLINKDGIKDGKLKLPKNLYIWATMNTSDQSLFPIDSAFKRRWDWVYMPIGYKNTNWTIEIGDKKYEWVKFQRIINDKIYGVDNSEDKQLGDYFVNADRTGCKISADTLLNKILFYIWNDVCKDDPDQIFQWVNDKKQNESIKFSDFFGVDKDKKLQGFMAYHKVPAIGETDNTDNADNTNIQEETPAENDKEINS